MVSDSLLDIITIIQYLSFPEAHQIVQEIRLSYIEWCCIGIIVYNNLCHIWDISLVS